MKVEPFSGEPIVLWTITGSHTTDDMRKAYQQIADVADQWGRSIYVIDDLSNMKVPWSTVLAGMNLTVKKLPGSPTDERINSLLVGASDIVKTIAEAMGKAIWAHQDIKVFDTVDEALSYARAELANGG